MPSTPLFFSHRINSYAGLSSLPPDIGLEIDIRDYESKLYLSHDPFCPLKDLCEFNQDFLSIILNRPLILNIKSERIEPVVNHLLETSGYSAQYFYLDSSFSVINKYGSLFPFAARLSDYEPLDMCKSLYESALVDWIWIDTFRSLPLTEESSRYFQSSGLKTCLTSPDLVGRPDDILPYFTKMEALSFTPTAICCKLHNIYLWRQLYSKLANS